jgi:hypothetical protein
VDSPLSWRRNGKKACLDLDRKLLVETHLTRTRLGEPEKK